MLQQYLQATRFQLRSRSASSVLSRRPTPRCCQSCRVVKRRKLDCDNAWQQRIWPSRSNEGIRTLAMWRRDVMLWLQTSLKQKAQTQSSTSVARFCS